MWIARETYACAEEHLTAAYQTVWRGSVASAIDQFGFGALAKEHGRIEKKPPPPVEVERIASDMVMNDDPPQRRHVSRIAASISVPNPLRPELRRVPSQMAYAGRVPLSAAAFLSQCEFLRGVRSTSKTMERSVAVSVVSHVIRNGYSLSQTKSEGQAS